jgi:hypothetical protein
MKGHNKHSDYTVIRQENERKYGTDIGRIGKMLLADRYADRTHFIFELLQNAEDALAKRSSDDQKVPSSIKFEISENSLIVSHYGKPFDENDVTSICGIAESTKNELTAIGRFGIGFKSVYSFTDLPAIHSGYEHFAIENYVLPKEIPAIELKENETKIILSLNEEKNPEYYDEILEGIKRINLNSLLFLHYIEEIEWQTGKGESGVFIRSKPEELDVNVRKVELVGETNAGNDISEKWLIFSKGLSDENNEGFVEIAFLMNGEKIQSVAYSPLVVFFPTEKQTNLGFLVQGPYRTTPSRDNIPVRDAWNQKCVNATSKLVVEALRWLRDKNLLGIESLRCFPMDRSKFSDTNMFESLFDIVKKAFIDEPLLPAYKGGYVSAKESLIARTKELRELFTPEQLSYLFKDKYCWLHDEISQDRTPDLRKYFMNELDMTEVQPDTIINKIDIAFLKEQKNNWIRDFYGFLNKQQSLHEKLKSIPIIRLSNMEYVVPYKNGQPQVWLPGQETDFPTVHKEVCGNENSESMAFLMAIGLTEPNPVDDAIRNILPKFDEIPASFTEETYKQAIQRIFTAFDTDSASQKDKLLSALKNKKFVAVINAATGEKSYAEPGAVYFQTESFKSLFDGIDSIYFVNEEWGLKGEKVRELLEKCGVYRNLRPVEVYDALSSEELSEIRRREGFGDCTSSNVKNDNTLYGLEDILDYIQCLNKEDKISRTSLIWKELCNLYERRRESVFSGTYSWSYFLSTHQASFDAYFIRILNKSAWIPDSDGNLQHPTDIIFNSLNWEDNPFLRSKIHFKSDEIQEFEEKTGYKAIPQDEYEQFKKWQEAQRYPQDEDETPEKEFTPAFSVADTPLKVNDFVGKDQSVPFDESQLNKSAAQNLDNDSSSDNDGLENMEVIKLKINGIVERG